MLTGLRLNVLVVDLSPMTESAVRYLLHLALLVRLFAAMQYTQCYCIKKHLRKKKLLFAALSMFVFLKMNTFPSLIK